MTKNDHIEICDEDWNSASPDTRCLCIYLGSIANALHEVAERIDFHASVLNDVGAVLNNEENTLR